MKKTYTFILAILLAMPSFAQITEENCMEDYQIKYGYPSYFCDCELQSKPKDRTLRKLPFDITTTDTVWYKSYVKTFIDGATAYLYSDCDITMVIMVNCTNFKGQPTYKEQVVQSNQSRVVDMKKVQELLNANPDMAGSNAAIKVGIFPSQVGVESRFICVPYGTGPHSTCEDCLQLIPTMDMISSNPDDVYVLKAKVLPETDELIVAWSDTATNATCQLSITQGSCDGAQVAAVELKSGTKYQIPEQLIQQLRATGEDLYLHFNHDEGTVGTISLSEKKPVSTDLQQTTQVESNTKMIYENGMIYILRGNTKYSIMGNRL